MTTMYFVDPDIINNGGRTPEMFEAQGTGDRLVMRVSKCLKVLKYIFEDIYSMVMLKNSS